MARNLTPIEPQTGSAKRLPQPAYARQPSPIGVPLPVGKRDVAERRRTRRRPVCWMGLLALLWIGTGVVYWLAAPPAVTVVHPLQGPAVQAVYATGTVEPTDMVPISAHSMARLVELNVDEGQTVVKGQVLARLEDDDLRRAVAVTRSGRA
jgi:multidrug efflux pump subunit AcrA (membrane-fusion protein)